MEANRITELKTASDVFDFPESRHKIVVKDRQELIRIWIQRTEYSVRNAITFTKRLECFSSNICPDDQLELFKYGCLEILFLRSLPNLDPYTGISKLLPEWDRDQYLLIKCGSESPSRLQKLMIILRDIEIIGEIHVKYVQKYYTNRKYPLEYPANMKVEILVPLLVNRVKRFSEDMHTMQSQ
ncbi:unnamed protein product [Oppiella nova]|uniref:NR LBD domain-containing protein n=1 Tax=Oppiella nova TaxID=334625 RepID=A0A7R9MGZ4_9ACAR|nr:unnamed protein product [Oppiella nova]CAG2177084.1 unnamed protein product [Oppiella nova]